MSLFETKPAITPQAVLENIPERNLELGSERVVSNSREDYLGSIKPSLFQRAVEERQTPLINSPEIKPDTIITRENLGTFIEYLKTQPIIFHGTSRVLLDSIMERGLNRDSAPVNESNWPDFQRICHEVLGDKALEIPGLDLDIAERIGEKVFGTGKFGTAASYAMRTVGEAGHRMLLTIPDLLERNDLPVESRATLEKIQTELQQIAKDHAPVVIKIGGGALDLIEEYQHLREKGISPGTAFVENALRDLKNPTAEDLIYEIRDLVGVNRAFSRIEPKDIIGFFDQVDSNGQLLYPKDL